MKDYNKHQRGFSHTGEAFYSETILSGAKYDDEIMLGFYDVEEGGTIGEFAIRWYELGGELVPRIEAYDDSWGALFYCADLMLELQKYDSQGISPNDLCKILLSLGFVDNTLRFSD